MNVDAVTDRPYTPKPEFGWKMSADVEAARYHPAWASFHRACAAAKLLFDHIEPAGRGQWACTAFTCKRSDQRWDFFHLADGRGATPIAALIAAYEQSGITVADAAGPLALLRGDPVAATQDDFDMEDILG